MQKRFLVYVFETQSGLDYRIATPGQVRHASKLVGYIVAERRADAVARLKRHLKSSVRIIVH